MATEKREYSIEAERHYYREESDRSAAPYDHLDSHISGSFGADAFRGKRVLDLGAGEGIYSAWIADKGGAAQVTGIELTEHRIRRGYEEKLDNLRFLSGDIFELGELIGNERYDIVFMDLVLHHIRHRLDEFAEIVSETLVEGGAFLAIEPNFLNPLVSILHYAAETSVNEGFLSPKKVVKTFERSKFRRATYGYFYRDHPWGRSVLTSSNWWFRAER